LPPGTSTTASDTAGLPHAFPYLLLPTLWSARNRARHRETGDSVRAALFGGIGVCVFLALFGIMFYLSWQLLDYEELGEYLVRLGLSWLFLTFLSFLGFSAVVTALSTFFLSEDLRLLIAAPVPRERLFYSRYARVTAQSSWMVVAFVLPILLGVGVARCAGAGYYASIPLTLVPFVLIPVAFGSVVTLALVNVFPARRARDVLMLMGLLFAVALVMLLRFVRPERLLSVQSLPDVTGFFAALQSPVTPLLPSFWAGEALFAALSGRLDALHLGCLWTTALAATVLARAAYGRAYFSGFSKAQEARKARFTRLAAVEALARRLPFAAPVRSLLVKDLKAFLRDTTQWSQLLLLLALVLVYVYNFRVLDLDRLPYMSGLVKNAYAFVNLGLASFVLAAIAVRFVFPAVSVEGPAFWIIRSAPVEMSTFLWCKFWSGLAPILLLSVTLTVVSNEFLGVDRFLKVLTATAIPAMAFALVGLAAGMGAQHPRFAFENVTQIAGSYGGIAFMILAVLFILAEIALLAWPASVYLWFQYRQLPLPASRQAFMAVCFAAALALAASVWLVSMRRGVRALQALGE
jgi:ABC-2 type transport system permease protein